MNGEENKNILITGANGFVGKHLIEFLLKKKYILFTLGTKEIKHTKFFKLETPIHYKNIEKVINTVKPKFIFHLAGSNPNADLFESFQINTMFGIGILEAVKNLNIEKSTKILLLGSAAEYGLIKEENLPILETHTTNPVTPYGISKLSMTDSALNWHNEDNHVTIVRPFSILGFNMPVHMALGNFFFQLNHSNSNEIHVGNLNTMRDFIDIKDFVNSIYSLLNVKKSSGQIVNLCSGQPTFIKEILDFYIKEKNKKVLLKFNNDLTRKNDMNKNFGSNKKLKSILNIYEFKHWKNSILELIQQENIMS